MAGEVAEAVWLLVLDCAADIRGVVPKVDGRSSSEPQREYGCVDALAEASEIDTSEVSR